MNTILHKFSWLISIIFHPLIYASIGIWIILHASPEFSQFNNQFASKFTQITFILTYLIPLAAFPVYKLIMYITKSEKNESRERRFLLLSTSIIYVFTYRIIDSLEIYNFIRIYMLLCCILMIESLIITYFYKISLHMIGIGGFIGLMLFMSFQSNPFTFHIIPYCFLLAGIIGTARLYLDAHNAHQIYSGFFTGITTAVIFLFSFPQ